MNTVSKAELRQRIEHLLHEKPLMTGEFRQVDVECEKPFYISTEEVWNRIDATLALEFSSGTVYIFFLNS